MAGDNSFIYPSKDNKQLQGKQTSDIILALNSFRYPNCCFGNLYHSGLLP